MIPSNFDYVVPRSLAEAVSLLQRHGADAKLLAGGHSLIPMMKLRLASPSVLIDLGRIAELRAIRDEADDVVIGAMATYHMLESSKLVRERAPLLAAAAERIGDVQVRNCGTIGGSLAHADPAADMPAAVLALDARMRLVGPDGEREVAADKFFVGMLQSAARTDEILSEIRVRRAAKGSGSAYAKAPQAASGFALVGVAASLTLGNGKCSDIRIALTGVASRPYRASAAEAKLRGSALDDDAAIAAACSGIADGTDTMSDIHASAEYRRALASVYARRAIASAATAARGGSRG
jgi:carbon-monoxide dehydrogenase medium subunit